MKQFAAKSKIIAVVLLAGLFPGLISLAAHWLLGDAQRVQEPLHECLELTGACIALGVGMLLWMRLRHEPTSPHLLWVVAALVSMGLVDGMHGVAPFGVAWSWLRHGATLIGGVLFGLVWLPLPPSLVRRKHVLICVTAGATLAVALGVWWRPQILPAPFVPGGYSFPAKVVNVLGGLGFLAAALFFFRRYLRQPHTENLVFASHTLLFGTSSLLFGFSHVWATDWWVWHGFRLLAYAIVLAAAYEVVVTLYQDLAWHARELEDRVQARTAELREQQEWLRVTLTSMGDAVIASDREARVVFLNPIAESLTDWPRDQALGQPIARVFRIVNELTHEPAEDLVARVLSEKRVVTLANHTALVTKDGREVPIEDSAAPILDAAGKVAGVVLVFHDVTEKRRAQEELRRAYGRLQTFFDHRIDGIGIVIANARGEVMQANSYYLSILGYTREEFLAGQVDWRRMTPPEWLPADERALAQLRERGACETYEKEYARRDGSRVPVLITDTMMPGDSGDILAFVIDITERKRVEQTLRENEERQKVARAVQAERQRLNEVLNMLPAYVILLSPDYHVPFANRYFERQFGKSNGKRCFEYLFNRAEPCENCETYKVLKTNAPHEWEWTGPDGRNYEIHDFPFTDADGSPMIMEMGIDITGRKRAEAALMEANTRLEQRVAERTKALTEAQEQLRQHAQNLEKTVHERTAKLQETIGELEHFSYSITHDMRAPLRGLSGYAHLMLTGDCGGCQIATSKDFLRRIDKAAQRMDQLITDALQYSQALRTELVLQPVDVAQLLRGMLESYPDFQPPKASIRLEGEFPLVLGNEAALTQCFSNFLDNAVKFVAPGTRPEISIWAERLVGGGREEGGGMMEDGGGRRDSENIEHPTSNIEPRSGTSDPSINHQPSTINSFIRLWFADNGIGIPKESQTRIFDMFQRVSKSYEGTGIGLALVRKNADRMGGKVGVESEPGRGSRFWLDLKTINRKIEA